MPGFSRRVPAGNFLTQVGGELPSPSVGKSLHAPRTNLKESSSDDPMRASSASSMPLKESSSDDSLHASSMPAVWKSTRCPMAASKGVLRPTASLTALAAPSASPAQPPVSTAYPDTLLINLDKLQIPEPLKKIFVRLSYRTEVRKTRKDSDLRAHVPSTFVFPCSFHAIVFDVIKLDVYEHKALGADVHVGRAYIRLAHLLKSDGELTATYSLRRRRLRVSPRIPMSGLAKADFSAHPSGEITVRLLLTQKKYARAALTRRPALSDPAPFVNNRETRPSPTAGTHVTPTLSASSQSPRSPHSPPFRLAGRALRSSPSLPILAGSYLCDQSASPTSSFDSAYAESLFEEMSGSVSPEEFSCLQAMIQEEEELVESDDDLVFTGHKKKGFMERIMSNSTRLLFNDFTAMYNAFFKSGWRMSKLEFMKCMVDLAKYYRENPVFLTQQAPSAEDVRVLKATLHYTKYCLAAYGSAMMNFFGRGAGIKDAVRLNSDRKAVCDVFGLNPKADLIAWQYERNQVFRPKFFVVRDPQTNTIVIVVRGTFSLQDAMTDLVCEYEPYKGGLAHRGVLKSAEWIIDCCFEDVKRGVKKFNATGINCVGHSLGGAVASLACLMIRDRISELTELTSSSEFYVHAYAVGAPPTVSRDIAEQAEPFVTAIVNEADVVPRMSFGNVTAMKAIVRSVAAARRDPMLRSMPSRTRNHHLAKVISLHRANWLSAERDHTRLFVAGTVFYMYKAGNAGIGPLPSVEERRAVRMEKSSAENFCDIAIRKNMARHHFPDCYDKRLRAALRWLESRERDA